MCTIYGMIVCYYWPIEFISIQFQWIFDYPLFFAQPFCSIYPTTSSFVCSFDKEIKSKIIIFSHIIFNYWVFFDIFLSKCASYLSSNYLAHNHGVVWKWLMFSINKWPCAILHGFKNHITKWNLLDLQVMMAVLVSVKVNKCNTPHPNILLLCTMHMHTTQEIH